jgi:hypothetical protein
VQLALDATEEGLLAIAGRSAQEFDQGLHHSHWDNALYLHKVRAKPSLSCYENFRGWGDSHYLHVALLMQNVEK